MCRRRGRLWACTSINLGVPLSPTTTYIDHHYKAEHELFRISDSIHFLITFCRTGLPLFFILKWAAQTPSEGRTNGTSLFHKSHVYAAVGNAITVRRKHCPPSWTGDVDALRLLALSSTAFAPYGPSTFLSASYPARCFRNDPIKLKLHVQDFIAFQREIEVALCFPYNIQYAPSLSVNSAKSRAFEHAVLYARRWPMAHVVHN
ncbi:hypothetical protein M758_UG325500 [Ceratodon purpureus]|nr:hypothetical protein M758_UG325500 [Ceratodon purpureus]